MHGAVAMAKVLVVVAPVGLQEAHSRVRVAPVNVQGQQHRAALSNGWTPFRLHGFPRSRRTGPKRMLYRGHHRPAQQHVNGLTKPFLMFRKAEGAYLRVPERGQGTGQQPWQGRSSCVEAPSGGRGRQHPRIARTHLMIKISINPDRLLFSRLGQL